MDQRSGCERWVRSPVAGRRFGCLASLVAWFLCMGEAEQFRENRLRRAALRQGLLRARSRRQDPRADDFGRYMPADMATNTLVAGDQEPGYDLNNAQGYINGDLS